jgi:carbonic anhydrase
MCVTCDDQSLQNPGRRTLFSLTAVGIGSAILTAGSARAADVDVCAPFTADMQKDITPDLAIQALMDGNGRFVAGKSANCNLLDEVKATAQKQTPFACVLACIDSRVPPELVFDQKIGDIFDARVAGNVPTTEILGSFEYATKVAGAKAILVLGHNHCGAIKGTIDKADVGANLTALLAEIEPVVEATPLEGERSSKNAPFVQAVAEANVRAGVAAMTEKSAVLKELVDTGALRIVGALYDIDNGQVTFLS